MFDLLFSITLDTLHQAIHGLILFYFKLGALTLHLLKCSLFIHFCLHHLLLRTLCPHKLSIVIFLYFEEDFFLIPQCNQVFARLEFNLSVDFIDEVRLFVFLFDP